MKVSFTRSWTSTLGKIFSGLREKRFDHEDIAPVFVILKHSLQWRGEFHLYLGPVPDYSLVSSTARWFSMASSVEGQFLFISWRFHWPYLVVQVYELITCFRRANENANKLISVVHICFTLCGIFLVEILCDQLFFDRYVALYRYTCRRIQVVQPCKPDRVLHRYICSSILVAQACKSDRVTETLKNMEMLINEISFTIILNYYFSIICHIWSMNFETRPCKFTGSIILSCLGSVLLITPE